MHLLPIVQAQQLLARTEGIAIPDDGFDDMTDPIACASVLCRQGWTSAGCPWHVDASRIVVGDGSYVGIENAEGKVCTPACTEGGWVHCHFMQAHEDVLHAFPGCSAVLHCCLRCFLGCTAFMTSAVAMQEPEHHDFFLKLLQHLCP